MERSAAGRAQGTFASKFDLRAFPFDTQQLRLEAILWDCAQDTVVKYGRDGKARLPPSTLPALRRPSADPRQCASSRVHANPQQRPLRR